MHQILQVSVSEWVSESVSQSVKWFSWDKMCNGNTGNLSNNKAHWLIFSREKHVSPIKMHDQLIREEHGENSESTANHKIVQTVLKWMKTHPRSRMHRLTQHIQDECQHSKSWGSDFGQRSNTCEVTNPTILRKQICLLVNGHECKSLTSILTKFLNLSKWDNWWLCWKNDT